MQRAAWLVSSHSRWSLLEAMASSIAGGVFDREIMAVLFWVLLFFMK